MGFLKKLFSLRQNKQEDIKEQKVYLSLDDSFVHHFTKKGGKFLYCTSIKEVVKNLQSILNENNWSQLTCTDFDLPKLLVDTNAIIDSCLENKNTFLTTCEHLISDNGNILFSSNQLKSRKLPELSENFIVYATTSQLVKNTGEALTGIKTNFKGNIPTNISAVKKYSLEKDDDNFMNYGNSNSKNLYLLLFEDL